VLVVIVCCGLRRERRQGKKGWICYKGNVEFKAVDNIIIFSIRTGNHACKRLGAGSEKGLLAFGIGIVFNQFFRAFGPSSAKILDPEYREIVSGESYLVQLVCSHLLLLLVVLKL
jgi:hypothetical protein